MPSLGNLTVQLSMDATNLQAGARKAREGLNTIGAAAIKTTAALAAITAAGFTALISKSTTAAKEITNLANLAGISASELQRLGFAANTVGVSTEKYADIIKDVNDKMGDFAQTGAGPMADFFENIAPKVGVTAEQFRKLSGPQALQLYVDSLEKANLSQADMTFYMEAIASDSTALLPLLKDNGAAMNQLAAKADKLGVAMSDIETEQLNQLGQSIDESQKIFGSFTNKLAAQFTPVVQVVVDLMEQAAEKSGGLGKAASDAFGFIIKSASFVANAVDGIKRVFELTAAGIIAFYSNVFGAIAERVSNFVQFINKLPGVNIDTSGIDRFADTMRGVASEAVADVGVILSKPMAGDVFQGFVEQAREKSEQAARAAVEARQKMLAEATAEPATGGDALNSEQQKQRLAILRSTLQEEKSIVGARYASEIEQINEFYQNKIGLEDEWRQVLLDKNAQFQADITAIDKAEAEKRKQEHDREQQAKAMALDTFFNDASSLMQSGSKRMQKIGKAAAIVNAIRTGWESAILAWRAGMEAGGPFGPAVAAAYAAASLAKTGAMIQSIKSGGSGSSGGGAGGGAAGAGSVSAPPTQNFNVSLSGFNPNQAVGMNQMGDVMTLINDRIRAGETFGGFSF